MPLYEYKCRACEHRFERIRKFSDPPLTECPSCGGKVEKLFSAPAFQFKGSGFYITDYTRKSEGGGSTSEGGGSTSEGGGSTKEPSSSPSPDSSSSKSSESSPADTKGSDKSTKTASKDSEAKPASTGSGTKPKSD